MLISIVVYALVLILKIGLVKKVNYIEKTSNDKQLGLKKSSHQVPEYLKEFVLRTKYNHWSYEEDCDILYRLKDTIEGSERKLKFYPFSDTLKLAEVILGPQCDMSLNDVRRLIKDR